MIMGGGLRTSQLAIDPTITISRPNSSGTLKAHSHHISERERPHGP
jgi:hypothetical protein